VAFVSYVPSIQIQSMSQAVISSVGLLVDIVDFPYTFFEIALPYFIFPTLP